jgi:hypothetical protein
MLSLGAINKNTGDYVYPKIANKKDDYVCPECNKELILCQGEVRVPYFRHKVDVNPCHHYTNPTESQIHKDAKMLLKTVLEGKTPIQFERECTSCKKANDIILPEVEQESIISLEHRFSYNGSTKIADVVHLLNGEVNSIFEIMHTHKTKTENRPEPWIEIDASWLLNYVNAFEDNTLKIKCVRRYKCQECLMYDARKELFVTIQKNKYKFITEKVSIFRSNFPGTTKMIELEDDDILIDCEDNFSTDEKKVIEKFNINNIEELMRHDKISNLDKSRSFTCYKYVFDKYELMGFEPFNGHNAIQLEEYLISIRISYDRNIKY